MPRKKKEPKPEGSGGSRPRGRPVQPTEKIPASFEEIAKAVLRPVKEEEKGDNT